MAPFFSIIIPCCDVEAYVRECFDSIFSQSFTDWECLIGIEESKDRTEEIIREITTGDKRFKIFTGPRSGSCSASRNTGTDMASGEYVIFLDGDDTIADGALERLHDKITARPGADIYPCAIQVHNDVTGKDEELRDNYPKDFNNELTGPEATKFTERGCGYHPCPMLQISVFRREFLVENALRCIRGLRRQDSEFSPRALYLAKRVIPLHEAFYLYRIQPNSVGSRARGADYFNKDWAIIVHSLLKFHARVCKEAGYDRQISECWARQGLPWIFYFWFTPEKIKSISREKRMETLEILFDGGFADFDLLVGTASKSKRIAAWWVRVFVKYPAMRILAECFFRLYFLLAKQA